MWVWVWVLTQANKTDKHIKTLQLIRLLEIIVIEKRRGKSCPVLFHHFLLQETCVCVLLRVLVCCCCVFAGVDSGTYAGDEDVCVWGMGWV